MNHSLEKAALAATVAGILGHGALTFADETPTTTDKVECKGVNSCKAKGECGGDGHGCAGENSCKGKGWISLSKKECDARQAAAKKSKKS